VPWQTLTKADTLIEF